MKYTSMFILLISLTLISSESMSEEAPRIIRAGLYENNPKIFTDNSGKPSGFFIELLEEIAIKENWQIEYVHGTWAELLHSLEMGEIDLMPDVALSPERLVRFSFHNTPVIGSWSQIYAREGVKIETISDLADKKIILLQGSVQIRAFEQLIRGYNLDTRILSVQSFNDAFLFTSDGEADAAVSNQFFGDYFYRDYNLVKTPFIFSPTSLYFATAKGKNRDLLYAIDRHIKDWSDTPGSVYYRVLRKWIEKPVPSYNYRSVLWITGGALFMLFFSLGFNFLLQWKVKQKTSKLSIAKSEAEAANRAKSDFLATMSHEIRTPLNAIIGMSDLAIMSNTPAEQQEYLYAVKDAGHHLARIINDILDFSKMDSDSFYLEKSVFSISRLVVSVENTFHEEIKEKGLQFYMDIDPALPESVEADSTRIKQIIINLMSNAIKFTDKGSIGISCKADMDTRLSGNQVKISVSVMDTGIGIKPEERENIFSVFQQSETGMSRKYGGTGLGLTISKKLARFMEGDITVESEPGRGSIFTFTFTAGLHEAADDVSRDTRLSDAPEKKLNVLAVDDNNTNCALIRAVLKKLGHTCLTAADGNEALELVKEHSFDIILMDIEMPGLDGIEAAKAVRRGDCGKDKAGIPVVALTAHALKEVRDKSFEAGINGYITKPVDITKLNEVLRFFAGF